MVEESKEFEIDDDKYYNLSEYTGISYDEVPFQNQISIVLLNSLYNLTITNYIEGIETNENIEIPDKIKNLDQITWSKYYGHIKFHNNICDCTDENCIMNFCKNDCIELDSEYDNEICEYIKKILFENEKDLLLYILETFPDNS